ncbi:MAG: hypothetical protein QGF59_10290, partial [Pirellulaceae bacterium]|nr:hypothetical protein [Pirellulaceae bacterium]
VLDKVTVETKNAIRMAETADLSRQQTEQACAELETTVAELREFNELSEGREQRMIGLKMEVNEFAGKLGQPQPYDVCPHQNEACQTADER